MRVLHVVGARPNFMKIAPIMSEMHRYPEDFQQILVHTGQHYDCNMSGIFFEQLGMPAPDEFLGVGSGSHADQTARLILAFEPVVLKHQPDWVVVVGDVNSTMACALVCAKLGIRVAHIEAGLRSGDRTMPEEINRVVTDHISDLLFTPSLDANTNLLQEGIPAEKIRFVGNVMIDSLIRILPAALNRNLAAGMGLAGEGYVLATIHRPANVDNPEALQKILAALAKISESSPVVFPVHPRTSERIARLALPMCAPGLHFIEPQGYVDFLGLMANSRLVLTDSGGIQEETTYLGIPCVTVRPNTERPVTLTVGTNRLVATDTEQIVKHVLGGLSSPRCSGMPDLWDGRASNRIVASFRSINLACGRERTTQASA